LWYRGFFAADNLLLSASDLTPFSIVAPHDPRLPGGGGYVVSGLYDVVPEKSGRVDNLITDSGDYGRWRSDGQLEYLGRKDRKVKVRGFTIELYEIERALLRLSEVRDAVVVLKTAKLEGDKLTFDVDVLEGDLAGGDGPAALFIDRFGFGGFHAGGFHAGGFGGFHAGGGFVRGGAVGVGRVGAVGVWHRPYVAHGAWYRGTPYAGAAIGAAAIGGAAVGAAAAGAYPYYGATCGYYPYPPCY